MVGKLSTYNSAHFRVFGVMAGARRGRVIRFFVYFVFLVSPKTVPLLAMRSVVEPDGKMKTNKKMGIVPYHSTVIVASLSIRFTKLTKVLQKKARREDYQPRTSHNSGFSGNTADIRRGKDCPILCSLRLFYF